MSTTSTLGVNQFTENSPSKQTHSTQNTYAHTCYNTLTHKITHAHICTHTCTHMLMHTQTCMHMHEPMHAQTNHTSK